MQQKSANSKKKVTVFKYLISCMRCVHYLLKHIIYVVICYALTIQEDFLGK